MNMLKVLFVAVMPLLMAQKINGMLVEAQPDVYMQQATQTITDVVQEAAEKSGFAQKYEVMVPTKAGIAINPWNKFIAYGMNPVSKLPILLINQEWFSSLGREEQLFLIARCFAQHVHGIYPIGMKFVPHMFTLFSILLILFLLWLLNKTAMGSKPKWIRILLAWLIAVFLNICCFNVLQLKLLTYIGRCHDRFINTLALEKTGNRETAVKSLEAFDRAIKADIASGDPFFVPYKDLFAEYAQALQQ